VADTPGRKGAGLSAHRQRETKGRADMRQSNRPPGQGTSGPQRPAVKITPAASAGPATPTPAAR
jgi:hypothetical protein